MIEELYKRTAKGVKFDLERMRAMCAAAGEPQTCAPAVLIAGTNGKGSVAAMCDAGLRAAGVRTGLYTSPHLVRFSERVRVDGVEQALDLDELVRYEKQVGITLTFFEAATFMAFVAFRRAHVEALVMEVGMGGRLDATNVCAPRVCAITTIGLDHEEFLGTGLAAIAGEKAGIIRAGVPVVVGRVPPEAFAVIEARANAVGAPLHLATADVTPALKGAHQRDNAAVYAEIARLWPFPAAPGLLARWPGRFDEREWHGMQVVLDGAHNPPAYDALDVLLSPRDVLIFGATEGRSHDEGLRKIARHFKHVVLCEPNSPRAITNLQFDGATRVKTLGEAFAHAERIAAKTVCVTGSLYLVGEAIGIIEGQARDTVADFR